MIKDSIDIILNWRDYLNRIRDLYISIKNASRVVKFALLIATTCGGTFLYMQTEQFVRLESKVLTLSERNAYEIAKKELGGVIKKAIPFRFLEENNNYIFVLYERDHFPSDRCVKVLKILKRSNLELFSACGLVEYGDLDYFGVSDKYFQYPLPYFSSGLRGTYGSNISLFLVDLKKNRLIENKRNYDSNDLTKKTPYQYSLGFSYRKELYKEVDLKDAVKIDTASLIKVHNFLSEIKFIKENSGIIKDPIDQWFIDHTVDFPQKGTKTPFIHRNLNKSFQYKSSRALFVETEYYRFDSMFKGPVIAIDKKSKSRFLVYVPSDIYSWISQMLFVKDCLWMVSNSDEIYSLCFKDNIPKVITNYKGYFAKKVFEFPIILKHTGILYNGGLIPYPESYE